MKEGWKYVKLKDVGITQTGSTPSKSEKANYGDYMPFVRPAELDIDNNGGLKYDTELKLSALGVNKTRLIKSPSVLMCCIGSVGKTSFCTKDVTCNQQINTITPYSDYNPKFVYYALISPLFQQEAIKIANSAKATLAIISKGKWENLFIPLPPLSEQHRIVSYLDTSFAQIDALAKQAEESLENAKALFQATLKELMEKKEGWEEKRMDEMCSIESKLVNPTDDDKKHLLHVGGANILSNSGKLIDLQTAEQEQITSGKFLFDETMVLYNKIRPYLVKVARPDFSGLCSADMYPLSPRQTLTRDFLYYILVTKDFTEYAVTNSARAGMPKVNRDTLFAYTCFIPPLSEQQSIVSTLDTLSANISQLQSNYTQTLANCQALKQALLREVFE